MLEPSAEPFKKQQQLFPREGVAAPHAVQSGAAQIGTKLGTYLVERAAKVEPSSTLHSPKAAA